MVRPMTCDSFRAGTMMVKKGRPTPDSLARCFSSSKEILDLRCQKFFVANVRHAKNLTNRTNEYRYERRAKT